MADPTIEELINSPDAFELLETRDGVSPLSDVPLVWRIYRRISDDTFWRVTHKGVITDRRDGDRKVEVLQMRAIPPQTTYEPF